MLLPCHRLKGTRCCAWENARAHTFMPRTLIDMQNLKLSLEEVRLLHDAEELFLVHLAVAIPVCFIDHLLKFFVGHTLSKFFCDTFKIFEGNLSSLIIVKQTKGL